MKGHLTESRIEADGTDELPVLSEEAILRFQVVTAVEAAASGKAEAAPAQTPAASENGQEGSERPLEASLETLRATLEAAEWRWQTLENRLKSQDRAIAELKTALRRPADPPAATPLPESLLESLPAPGAQKAEARDGPADDRSGERELLERIAALETYIAGRADRWREMEQEVDAKSGRIAELEAELAQRIAREQQLEERLHHQGGRAEALRDRLRRMNRRLEHARSARPGPDLDPTSELTGPEGEVASIAFDPSDESRVPESGDAPELVCLSSDLGERYVMNKEAITIGRAADCDIQISADFVSRQHATIRRENSDMYIEDESSTNGVYVNAERVRRRALADGDEITIGESRFRFISSQPPH
ncbi:MAG TPA: FHA domain-containing protein [Gammaproteobacteria bacterium]|nr:FHA domain-containing protein [Gammaproteobacteria bacterium]